MIKKEDIMPAELEEAIVNFNRSVGAIIEASETFKKHNFGLDVPKTLESLAEELK